MTKHFTHCNVPELDMLYKWHVYANNTMHIVCVCSKCGKYMGNSPQISPYTDLVKGQYISAPKKEKPAIHQIKTVSGDPVKEVLQSILNIPGVKEYIGAGLYNKAKTMV